MHTFTHDRVAIIGAGSVGSTICYALMIRGLASQIVLIDVNTAKCEAEVKDLAHGQRFVPGVRLTSGRIEDCAGAAMVIITAGAKQKPGQSRLDLTQTNVNMLRTLVPEIVRVAPDALVLMVSNPVDVLTYAAAKLHPGGAKRVFGSGTVLDTARFVMLIAERMGVAVRNVHALIVGEHGDSEIPLWSSAHIGNIPLAEFSTPGHDRMTDEDRTRILAGVRGAAGEIIAAKGATNWAIGLATARIVEAVLRDENAVLTVSRLLENYAGVSDVCLSVPCIVNRAGVGEPLAVPMNETELAGFRASADVVRKAGAAAGL